MNKINLNYSWKYLPHFEEKYIKEFPESSLVNIPHTNKELPYNNFSEKEYQFISSYQKAINLDKQAGKRYIIHFEGVMIYSEVYVNEKLVTIHKGGYTPFKVDVTDYVVNGKNKIFVKVDSTERKDIPPHGFVVDYLTYGGIYREVSLEEREPNFVDMAFVHTENNELIVRMFLDVTKKEDVVFTYKIKKENEVVHEFQREYDLSRKNVVLNESIQLEKWTLENPVLYTFEIYMGDVLSYSSRFGDRDVKLTEKGFFLNDKHIKLYGLNRHQAYPYVGYAMPKNAQRKDADILKYDLGCNTVRSSHYPPSKHFLDRCDEIGLLVFNEIPGWQHIGDEAWQEIAIQSTKEMIYRDYNHPSIFIWGTRINESPDNDSFYTKTAEVARGLDLSRPIGGVRNFKGSKLIEDVYTYNDFAHRGSNEGLESAKKVSKLNAPHLITEYNGHMYPTKKFDDEWHRIEQAKRHLNVQNDSFKSVNIAGAIGWCMFDYNTHKDFGSGDRICYHGVMDMFRIPKYAASVYRSQSEVPYLSVLSSLNVGEKEASEIKELLVLTNADYVKFYINKDFIGDFYSTNRWDSLPHSPVIIDDFIGRLIHDNEEFNEKDSDTIKSILLSIMKYGMQIPIRLKIRMFMFLRKHKMSIDQAAKFYEKYVGKWGQESITYRFEAIKDDKVVAEEVVGATYGSELRVTLDDQCLAEEETYEVTRVVVEHVNNNGNLLTYSNEVIGIDVEGSLELIGPRLLTLTGGSIGFYLKTIGKVGVSTVKITSNNFKDLEYKIEVK